MADDGKGPELCFFDLEATGTDPYTDRICEVFMIRGQGALLFGTESPDVRVLHRLVHPVIGIPPEATAVHGIDEERLREAGAEPFSRVAGEVLKMIDGATLVGYNCRVYDTPLLDAELRRNGHDGLSRDDDGRIDVPEIDLLRVWTRLEPRTLAGAVRRFLGGDLDDAHSARADTEVLPRLLVKMATDWQLSPGAMMAASADPDEIDRAGRFRRAENGDVLFAFGKYDGTPAADQPDYLRWMLGQSFPEGTRVIARKLLHGKPV